MDYENIQEMIGVALDEDAMQQLSEIQKQKILVKDGVNKTAYAKTLERHFENIERNRAIKNAFDDGYTQAKIAAYLNASRSLISKLLKGRYSTLDT